MKLSIVATLYQSAPHLLEFYEKMSQSAAKSVGDDYEIILVNDGSPDDSRDIALSLSEKDSKIIVIDLSKNFGHHHSMRVGLSHTRGNQIFLIDSDLEEDPEWLPLFEQELASKKCDFVVGFQNHRKGKIFERMTGWIFWSLFNWIAESPVVKNQTTARLMTRRFVNEFLKFEEQEFFLHGVMTLVGFENSHVDVVKKSTSETTYTFRKRTALMLNAITSFSTAPLKIILLVGLIIALSAAAYASFLILEKLFFHEVILGWTSVMVSIWFIGGLIISLIGSLGVYISKIFSEIKRRPTTIIREIYQNGKPIKVDSNK